MIFSRLAICFVFIVLAGLSPAGQVKADSEEITVLMLGDSLTAGYGVMPEQAWPALVEKMCKDRAGQQMPGIRVINAGISGSTSAGAYSRVKWFLKSPPKVLVLALGANDGLRGLSVEQMEENLDKAIRLATDNGIRVILAAMEVPPNLGNAYAADFRQVFFDLAARHRIPLIPFLLKGVAGIKELNQADGIHPNARGHEIIAKTVLPFILEAL